MTFADPLDDQFPVLLLGISPLLLAWSLAVRSRLLRGIGRTLLGADLLLGAVALLYPHNHHWIWFRDRPYGASLAMDAAIGTVWLAGCWLLLRAARSASTRSNQAEQNSK